MAQNKKNNLIFFLRNIVFILFVLSIRVKGIFAYIPEEGIPTSTPIPPGSKGLGTFEGLGPLGNPIATPEDPGTSTLTKFISTTIGIMTIVGIIWFIFVLFSGAIAWLSSGGDKQKLQNAQKQITTGLTGLIIVLSAIFLAKIAGSIFGMDLLNIQALIGKLNN